MQRRKDTLPFYFWTCYKAIVIQILLDCYKARHADQLNKRKSSEICLHTYMFN